MRKMLHNAIDVIKSLHSGRLPLRPPEPLPMPALRELDRPKFIEFLQNLTRQRSECFPYEIWCDIWQRCDADVTARCWLTCQEWSSCFLIKEIDPNTPKLVRAFWMRWVSIYKLKSFPLAPFASSVTMVKDFFMTRTNVRNRRVLAQVFHESIEEKAPEASAAAPNAPPFQSRHFGGYILDKGHILRTQIVREGGLDIDLLTGAKTLYPEEKSLSMEKLTLMGLGWVFQCPASGLWSHQRHKLIFRRGQLSSPRIQVPPPFVNATERQIFFNECPKTPQVAIVSRLSTLPVTAKSCKHTPKFSAFPCDLNDPDSHTFLTIVLCETPPRSITVGSPFLAVATAKFYGPFLFAITSDRTKCIMCKLDYKAAKFNIIATHTFDSKLPVQVRGRPANFHHSSKSLLQSRD